MSEKNTSFQTICRVLLHEMRLYSNTHQAHLAKVMGLSSSSSWSKVESGDVQLTLEHIVAVCSSCNIALSNFFFVAHNYMNLLTQNNWYVSYTGLPIAKEDDHLDRMTKEYNKLERVHYPPQDIFITPWTYNGTYNPILPFSYAMKKENPRLEN